MKDLHPVRFYIPILFLLVAAGSAISLSFQDKMNFIDVTIIVGNLIAGLLFSFDLWRRSRKQTRKQKELVKK